VNVEMSGIENGVGGFLQKENNNTMCSFVWRERQRGDSCASRPQYMYVHYRPNIQFLGQRNLRKRKQRRVRYWLYFGRGGATTKNESKVYALNKGFLRIKK
jgi:hypothetical protein